MPLQPEFKAKFVEALRSGKYKKCRGHLRRRDKDGVICNCPLGVACDLVEPEKWVDEPLYGDYCELLGYMCRHRSNGSVALTTAFMERIGMAEVEHRTIVELNDLKDWTFEEIANHIERCM